MDNNNRPLDVSVVACETYDPELCKSALKEVLAPLGGLDFVEPGNRVVIKANLITFLWSEAHPWSSATAPGDRSPCRI